MADEHAANNRMPPPSDLLYPNKIEDFRRTMTIQRNHVGRIQAGILLLAYAVEAEDPNSPEASAAAHAAGVR